MSNVNEPHRISACPLSPDCDFSPGYPEDYQDPPWSTDAEFAEVVLPARVAAIEQRLTAHLASHGFHHLRFEWAPPR